MEDDDDFGDFKFASSYPNPAVNSDQINGWSFPATTNDDEWGDFFNHSSTKTLSTSQSLPIFPEVSTTFDPFGFSDAPLGNSRSPGSVASQAESLPGRIDSDAKNPQSRVQGALPLSIFGEEEEMQEDQSSTIDSSLGGVTTLFPPKTGNSLQKGLSLNAGVDLNDLIANLYNQNHQINPENDLDLKTNKASTGLNGPNLGVNSDLNGLNPDAVDGNVVDVDGDDDDDGWEFKVAEADPGVRCGTSEIKRIAENELNLNFTGSKLSRSWLSLDSSGLDLSFLELSSSTNGLNSNLGTWDGDGFDGWGFKREVSTSRIIDGDPKVDGNEQQSCGRADNNYVVGSGPDGPSDLFGTPVPTSNKSGDWNFGFDFNPNFVTQDGITSLHSKNKPNDSANGINSSDEFIWEFKDASSTIDSTHKLEEPKVVDVLPAGNALAVGANDSLAAVDMISHGSDPLDFGFSFNPCSKTEGGSDSYKSQQNDIMNGLTSSSVDANIIYNENLWGFKDSFPEIGSKHQTVIDDKQILCNNILDSSMFSSQTGGDDFYQNSWVSKDALSGSKAEDKNSQNGGLDSSVNGGDDFGLNSWEFKGSFSGPKGEDQTSVNNFQNLFGNGSDPAQTMLNSDVVNDDDDDDDDNDDFGVDSWEFKGVFSGITTKEQTCVKDTQKLCENRSDTSDTASKPNLVNGHDISWDLKDACLGSKVENQALYLSCNDSFKSHPTALELEKYLDFYGKLKNELCYIAECHLNNLKKARRNGVLSDQDAKDEALDDDIQEFYNELRQDNIELHSEDIAERNSCLNELLDVLKEPMFQMLESEYRISERLSVAVNDLRSAIELLKHVTLTLKILRLLSAEEQFNYVSTWHKIISVCAEELEHGALIWNQSLQKNVHDQILSGPQGKKYILGLGEIYRVVEVIGASAKLYKPWVLLCSANSTALFAILSKCSTLWSSSGVEKALESISDPIDLGYDGTISALRASIKSIHDLDVGTLQKHVLPQQEPVCRLSLLSPNIVLDMKLVVWNQEHYFLKVANLWANLVSRDPPNLSDVYVG